MSSVESFSMRPKEFRSGKPPRSSHPGGLLVLLSMELHKLKGSSFWWMALGMIALVSAWSGLAFIKRAESANPATRTVALAQGEIYQTVGLLAPILAALLTSRLAGLESGERMDLKWRSLGQDATERFLTKLIVAGCVITLCFVIPLTWVPLAASAQGFHLAGSLAEYILVPALIACFSTMAVTAIQLVLSLTINKQAIGLGLGVIAGLIGTGLGPMNMPGLGWLFPAGISSAASPFLSSASPDGFASMTLVANPWTKVLTSLLACIIWSGISAFIVKAKELCR
ncbi:ABC transporter permease [Bifidobacterium sp. B4107]|uniref:ABC transporter permease n=1 Tax=unclassified Bifidobacterium TaxID=2608897 RepID=UPI00226B31ED|nr:MULTISPECIES: ABC transporter permease [unclassified Bifidobacterium]MCX8647569.1 ABC transporter permease [Bifidobacterium sp. B4107]MCX8651749.1 ABC transporter permease [Bifidobacterium sp. B4111]MCX8658180.1 ABC transporter permease [Bifidobacterium sp. B4114]